MSLPWLFHETNRIQKVRDVAQALVEPINFETETVGQSEFESRSKRVTLCVESVVGQIRCLIVYNERIGDWYTSLNSKVDGLPCNRHQRDSVQEDGAKDYFAKVSKNSHGRKSDGCCV